MSVTELCEVVVTAPDPEWLKNFSRALIEDGLCASAHNYAPIRSIYRWRGQVYERTEGRVSLHTRRERVPEIVARAKREHPYEVPGVSARPINDGNPDYLTWIAHETAPTEADTRTFGSTSSLRISLVESGPRALDTHARAHQKGAHDYGC